ncbi:MAG: Mur ligase family protein [Mycoplasmatales bacterium]
MSNLTVVGITGSYGKTSIKNIINEVLQEEKITLQTPSSFNTPVGLSITINKDLTKMHEIFLAEMGAYYPGEIKELANMVKPKIGIVSSIGPQHLETFKSIKNIQKTKMELIENLPIDGLGILNYDNQNIREYNLKNKVPIKWYSLEEENVDLYAYDIIYLEQGMNFKIKFKNEEYQIETKLLGKYNVYNILAAILVADYEGIPINKIIKNIKKINKIEKRLEIKYINKELTIIDDSFNGNIVGMQEGFKILSKYNNLKILITPGIIDGGTENYKINKELSQSIEGIDYILFVGKYNRQPLHEGLKDNLQAKDFDNFLDAYNYAVNLEGKKTILVANDLPDKYN